jgi:sec-independent protein translocase protein TatC
VSDTTSQQPEDPVEKEQPFLTHLFELRDRLLRIVLAVLIIFLGLFSFANDLYTILATPLMVHLPEGSTMIATEVASPFLTPFKLTLVLSIFLAMPFLLYQIWSFIAPGLYSHERRLIVPLLTSSTILFYLGMAFAYYVVFPLVFGFFTSTTPDGVAVMTDIAKYLDFVLKLFFAFGIAFEVPIAVILLIWTGMTTAESLGAKRPYIIVGAFVIGMLLTPPDVISQTLLALPMWLLFELGLIASVYFVKLKKEDQDDDDPSGGSPNEDSPVQSEAIDPEDLDAELARYEYDETALEEEEAHNR